MLSLLRNLTEVTTVLAGVVLASFLLMHWLPGDPAELYGGQEASQRDIERLRQRMGLDQPVWVQIANYAYRLLGGDLGESLRSGKPVSQEIATRLPTTRSASPASRSWSVLRSPFQQALPAPQILKA